MMSAGVLFVRNLRNGKINSFARTLRAGRSPVVPLRPKQHDLQAFPDLRTGQHGGRSLHRALHDRPGGGHGAVPQSRLGRERGPLGRLPARALQRAREPAAASCGLALHRCDHDVDALLAGQRDGRVVLLRRTVAPFLDRPNDALRASAHRRDRCAFDSDLALGALGDQQAARAVRAEGRRQRHRSGPLH